MDTNPYNIMDPRYSSCSLRSGRSMTGNMPGLETGIYGYPATERGYRNSFVERPIVDPSPLQYELIKYWESSYPSSVDPRTPVKVNFEEDTLILDDIPVVSGSGGSSGNHYSRRSAYRSGEDFSSSSAGSRSRGSRSQSSRGKGERRPSNFSLNSLIAQLSPEKVETLRYAFGPTLNLAAAVGPETPTYATPRPAPGIPKPPAYATPRLAPGIPKTPAYATPRSAPIVPKTPSPVVLSSPRSELVNKTTPSSSSSVVLSSDWSPLDDGIMVNLPSNPNNPPTRAEVDSHIQKVMYGPSTRKKRLPVFEEIYSP